MTAPACADPACDGTIDDGYCDVCGLAAPAAAVPIPEPRPASHTATAAHSAASGRTSGRSRRSTPTGSTRRRLGSGLVDLPELAAPDPLSLVAADPQVAEKRRFCAHCEQPVGRGRGDQPGRTTGFCAACGRAYSFVPALSPGDRIGSYEIAGALAHGGQGWIYLARDRTVAEDFWVVLKGLLAADDPEAQAAAIAERQFLAAVRHPNIVTIHTFVEHEGVGYIVMEYVGGTSLREVLKTRREAAGRPDPLPVAEAVAYVLAVLPAFAYLHRNGLVFCDVKPDNVMLGRDALTLIDLGAVRRIDDPDGAVYGTVGYQAPEIATAGPSVASDIFTLGRTLAALLLDFRGNTGPYKYTLPPAVDHPPLARYESLYRFLLRATAADPDDRFDDADEMADELQGVLREIVAAESGTPVGSPSKRFTGNPHPTGEAAGAPAWAVLPALIPAADDPAGVEVRLELARARVEAGRAEEARAVLDEISAADPWEWRVHWYRGLLALEGGDPAAAYSAFDRVWAQVPGELAPRLALARAAEATGRADRAAALYDVVCRTDDTWTSAAFGLARVRAAAGDRAGAVAAYRRVPAGSAAGVEARVRVVRTLVGTVGGSPPGQAELREASVEFDRLVLDPGPRARVEADLLLAGLGLIGTGAAADPGLTLAGRELREVDLRFGLEAAYREQARAAARADERIRLVDEANRLRPRTLV